MAPDRKPRILWGITASVAAIRSPLLLHALRSIGEVQAVVTERAMHFLDEWPADVPLQRDENEWRQWKQLGDPVLHIELRRWADVFVIAPLSADALAKISAGICDNLLLSVARAWDFSKPMVLAPAMNTLMWEHPVTGSLLQTVKGWGVHVVEPVTKKLACADVGIGALAPPDAVAAAVLQSLRDDSGQ